MKQSGSAIGMLAALVLGLMGANAMAEGDLSQAGREILKKNSPALVTVMATQKIKISAMGQEQDMGDATVTGQGTIIDPSGLTVVPNSALDPSGLLKGAASGSGPEGQPVKLDIKSELSDIKLRMPDGTEIPGKLVLKDEDLDLAYIRPDDSSEAGKKLAGNYPCVKMEKTTAPEPMDKVVSLRRAEQELDWQVGVQEHQISMVVKKPRTRYVSLGIPSGSLVFNAEGKALGIVVPQKSNSTRGGGRLGALTRMMSSSGVATSLIVPAGEIANLAKEAPLKAAETKPAQTQPAK